MQTVGINDLQTNPAILTKLFKTHEYSMITQHSKPIGIAVAFDDTILTHGLQKALLVDTYKNGLLSLGQLSKTLKILSLMGIDVVDYNFEDI